MTIDLRRRPSPVDAPRPAVADTPRPAVADPPLPVGVDLLAAGCFKEALVCLRLALAAGDTTPITRLNLAIAEDHTGDKDYARHLCGEVAAELPDWDEPIVRLAESLRAAGEYEAAESAYRTVLELNPARPEALIALSGLLLMREQPEAARELLLRCCRVAPDNAEAWNTLGLALRATGEPGLALSAFITAQRLRPHCLEYVLNGVDVTEVPQAGAVKACIHQTGDRQEADRANNDPPARALNQGDAELARLTVASEQNPLNPVLLIGRGMLLERLGRRSEAIDALEAATALTPDELVPLRLLSGILARSSRVRQAEQVLRRVIVLDPDNPQDRHNYAVVLMRLHRYPEARGILLEVLDSHGPYTPLLGNLANATACVGRQDEAVEIARRAISLGPGALAPRRALCNTLP